MEIRFSVQLAANLMTIVSTAASNDLDVWTYLRDVLDQILAGRTDWESLRADRWKEQHPEAVRIYRVEGVAATPSIGGEPAVPIGACSPLTT